MKLKRDIVVFALITSTLVGCGSNGLLSNNKNSNDSTYIDISDLISSGYDEEEYVYITYSANGGVFSNSLTKIEDRVEKGSMLIAPETPTRTGYMFKGWSKSKNKMDSWNFGFDMAYENTTLYAIWEEEQAKIISFEGAIINNDTIILVVDNETNSVSLSNKVVCSENSVWKLYYDELGQKEIPTKICTGLSGFLISGDNEFYIVVSSLNGDVVNVYKLVVHKSYHINIYYYFNTKHLYTEEIYSGYEFALSYVPEITGYTFNYWMDEEDNKITKVLPYSSMSFYANATNNNYTVTLDSNNNEDAKEVTVTYDKEYTLLTPTKVGYTFTGWYYNKTQLTYSNGKSIDVWNIDYDCTLTAHYSVNAYEVVLKNTNTNAGTITGAGSYDYDSSVTIKATPNAGYSFVGWYDSKDNCVSTESKYTFTMGLGCTLTAKWKANEYKVTFNVNGGNELETSEYTYTYDNEYRLPIPTRVGHTFIGWYYNDTLVNSNKWNIPTDCTLVAYYSANPYELTLNNSDNNAGTILGAGIYDYYSTVTVNAIPNDGYTFIGWYDLDDNCISTDNEYAFIMGFSSVLKAKWKVNEYKVTFDVNGGNELETTEYTYIYDNEYTLPIPTRDGYTFTGWYYNDSFVTSGKWNIANDCTLTAHYSANPYEVVLNNDNTKAGTITGAGRYDYESPVTIKATANAGYTFIGWYDLNNNCVSTKSKYTFTMGLGCTYVAKWELNTYNITYELNGGIVNNNPSTYNYEDETITLNNPTKVGYTFIGWTGENYETPTLEVTIPSHSINNRSYVANWKANEYKVTFNVNGGNELETSEYTYTYDNEYTLPIPKKEGHTFTGWYYNDTLVNSGKWNIATDCTLVGNWKANEYKVTFDVNGGNELETTEYTYTYDNEYTLPTPIRDGYTFTGWYYNDTLVSSGKWNVASECTLVASYSLNSYDVILNNSNNNAGTITGAGSYDYGSTVTINATPNEYYSFIGWYDLNDNCISTDSEYTFTMGLGCTLTAKWDCEDIIINYIVDGKTVYTSTYTLDNHVTELYQYETDKCFYGWYKTNTFNSDDDKVTSTEELKVENNNIYLYGTVLDANYSFKYENNGYTITKYNDTKEEIVIPSLINEIEVKTIGSETFKDCDVLKSVVIPSSVTLIGSGAFSNCTSLETITLPFIGESKDNNGYLGYIFGASSYEDNLSYVPRSLKEVIILEGCTSIQNYAFYKCGFLTNIIIPRSVTSIGENAFYLCDSLLSILIPSNVTLMADEAFNNCYSLIIYCETSSEQDGWDSNWNYSDRPVYYGVTKEDIIEKDGIQYLIIEGKAVITRYIGNDDNVVIPSLVEVNGTTYDVTEIGEKSFSESFIKSIKIHINVTSIGSSAFYNCNSLTNVYYEGTIKDWCNITFNNAYSNPMSKASNFYMLDESNNYKEVTSIEIPSTVTSIGDYQFYGFINLKSITISNSVTSVRSYAFYNYKYISNVYYSGTIEDWCNITFNNAYSNPMSYASHIYMLDDSNNYKEVTSIEISSTVTSIGKYQFYGFNNVTSIIIPSSVTTIGSNAFSGCGSLTNVYYSGTIEDWCNITFSNEYSNPMSKASHFYMLDDSNNYKEVTSIEIPSTITSIGNYQFYGFNNITSTTIPSSITYIGSFTFKECSSLTNITLSSSITSIGEDTFKNCNKLTNVYYEGTIEDWCNIAFNNVYSNPMSKASHFYMLDENNNYKEVTSIEIPSTITSIGDYQFYGFSNVISITIPNSVTSIEKGAFLECTSLKTITLPFIGKSKDSNKYLGYIFGASSYEENSSYVPSSLKEVMILEGCTLIYRHAFSGCSSLTSITIPSGVTTIGYEAFYECSSLTSIIIPSSVTTIEKDAFYGCNSFQYNKYDNGLYLGNDENPYVVLVKAKDKYIKSCIINENTRFIYEDAFYDCTSLETITLPFIGGSKNSDQYLGYLFGASSYKDNSSYVPSSLKEVIILDGCTSISSYAFYNCQYLISITIPSSVTSIGSSAFEGCTSLETITLPFIGGSKDSNQYLGYLFGASSYEDNSSYVPSSLKKVIILEGCTSIPWCAFKFCSSLTNITIPSSVTIIGLSAFSGCNSLTSITIPSSVTTIGSRAFYGCTSLETVIFEENSQLESIEKDSFKGCTSLETITLPFIGGSKDSNQYLGYIFGASSYSDNSTYVPSSLKEVIILEGCTSIGDDAFYNCSSLTSITIPSSVISIRYGAFSNCSSLTSITIPSSVTTIGSWAFSECNSLTNVYYDGTIEDWCNISFNSYESNPMYKYYYPLISHFYMLDENNNYKEVTSIEIPSTVTSIGNYQFYGFNNVTSITIPSSVTSIGSYAFSNCSSLTSITIPSSVKTIGSWAFFYCSSLTKIVISSNVTSIGYATFKGCTSLETITLPYIPGGYLGCIFGASSYDDNSSYVPSSLKEVIILEGCTSIGEYAFSNCSFLTSIIIPSSVNLIGQYAFDDCDKLTNVYYEGTIEDWCNITFNNGYSNPMYYASHFYMLDENNNYKEVTSIEIPSTVTSIRNYQFWGFNNVTSIIIPSSVTSIGSSAFRECSSLMIFCEARSKLSGWDSRWNYSNRPVYYGVTKEDIIEINGIQYLIIEGKAVITRYVGKDDNVVIPSIVEINGTTYDVTEIGDRAFSNSNIKTIIIPSSVKSIGNSVFSNCSSLTSITIPSSVTSIEYGAFRNCTSLTSITIPSSVTSIGSYAFSNCSSLTIYYEASSEPSGWISYWNIDNRPVYYGVTKEDIIEINGIQYLIIEGKAVITNYIGNDDNVVIPSIIEVNGTTYDVTEIKEYVFSNCSSLTNVYYEGTIEDWCNIKFDSSRSNPMYYASHFYMLDENNNYKEVTSIEISSIVTSIGNFQFYGFNNVTSITIPSSVTTIGSWAFYGCTSLETVIFEENSQLESIGEYAFYNCNSLTSITIPNSVTSIGGGAFIHCSLLINVIIPSGVTTIGYGAFSHNGVSHYYRYLTIYCESISKPSGWNSDWNIDNRPVYYGVTKEDIIEIDGIQYLIIEGKAVITRYVGNDDNVVIPSIVEVNGTTYYVTEIGEYAFSNSSIKSITIPSSVTSIGSSAFYNCSDELSMSF